MALGCPPPNPIPVREFCPSLKTHGRLHLACFLHGGLSVLLSYSHACFGYLDGLEIYIGLDLHCWQITTVAVCKPPDIHP